MVSDPHVTNLKLNNAKDQNFLLLTAGLTNERMNHASAISKYSIMLGFFNSSVKQNISRRRFYLLLSDGRHMAVIEVEPLTTTMLHQMNNS